MGEGAESDDGGGVDAGGQPLGAIDGGEKNEDEACEGEDKDLDGVSAGCGHGLIVHIVELVWMKMKLGLILVTVLAVAFQLVWSGWWWVLLPLLWWSRSGEAGAELVAFGVGLWLDAMLMPRLGVSSLVLVLTVAAWKMIASNTGGGEWWMGGVGVAAMMILSWYMGGINLIGVGVIGVLMLIVLKSDLRVNRGGLRLLSDRI